MGDKIEITLTKHSHHDREPWLFRNYGRENYQKTIPDLPSLE